MQKKLVWLSTSLFCKRSHWQYLIKNGIMPFLERKPCKQYLTSYSAELNYLSGENIRFSLLAEEQSVNNLIVYADSYFKDIFSTLAVNKAWQPASNAVFVAFPTNTIQYGLYAPIQITEDEIAKFAIRAQLSATMLEALSNDAIDDEIVLSLAFYLSICLLEVLAKSYPNIYMQLFELYTQNSYTPQGTLDGEYLDLKFQENKIILCEIIDQVINRHLDALPSWALSWMHICDQKLHEEDKVNDNYALSFYWNLSRDIYRQLGFNESMEQILFYFVKNTLKFVIETVILI